MTMQQVAEELGMTTQQLAKVLPNPEDYETREEWIAAHDDPQVRLQLYADWAEPDPSDLADQYNEERAAADAQG